MFGHVQANMASLSEEEKARYRAAYCGLCHRLGELYGDSARLSLSYDMSFLVLLLSSLYEPEERQGECRCIVHPVKKHGYMINEYTDYAADMTVALSYFKCQDDWQDDRSIHKKLYASLLKGSYEAVRDKWPEQCRTILEELAYLSALEKRDEENLADEAANSFGRLMAGIFCMKNDHWKDAMVKLGYELGRFIYLADAAIDLDEDRKSGSFNPLISLELNQEDISTILKSYLGEATKAFEMLPLVQDAGILRNILYSGILMKYNEAYKPESEREAK